MAWRVLEHYFVNFMQSHLNCVHVLALCALIIIEYELFEMSNFKLLMTENDSFEPHTQHNIIARLMLLKKKEQKRIVKSRDLFFSLSI
jgi:hypothetical protein